MKRRKQPMKLAKRNFLVPLLMKKTGSGAHKNKKREFKNSHKE